MVEYDKNILHGERPCVCKLRRSFLFAYHITGYARHLSAWVDFEKYQIIAATFYDEYEQWSEFEPIKFCPFCGRKFETEDL